MTDETKARLINGVLLIGGLAVLFESALPDPVTLGIVGVLGAGFVVLVAPSWMSETWSGFEDWPRSR